MDDKYKEIFYIDEFEIVPKWKQCGEYNPDWSDDEKYLWNSGCYDHHMELVSLGNPEQDKRYAEKCWYVWKDHWRGNIVIHDNGQFTAEMKEVMMGWSSPPYDTLEGAVDYIIHCYHAKKEYYKKNKNGI